MKRWQIGAGLSAICSAGAIGQCNDEVSRIDSAPDEDAEVNVCPCFTPGEVAMTILDVPPGGSVTLSQIQIFWQSIFGGQPDSLEAALIVYDMNQTGPADPQTFVPLCSEIEGCILEGPVLGDGFLNAFDVSVFNIQLPESRFGLGIEFLTNTTVNPFFTPSVASDNDGHNNAGGVVRNWVLVNGNTWQSSQSLMVSGDWIIRAVVEICEADSCPWDFDPPGGDGEVGITEFLILLGSWGTFPGGPPDFDGGGVGITDFLKVLGTWGPCP